MDASGDGLHLAPSTKPDGQGRRRCPTRTCRLRDCLRAPPKSGASRSATPASAGLKELTCEPVFDDLPWPESA